jgi:hypothetical protein
MFTEVKRDELPYTKTLKMEAENSPERLVKVCQNI